MKAIMIFGPCGSGKDTIGDYLKDKYGYATYSLGSKIRSECKLYGDETRNEMQDYAKAMIDIFGDDVWCKHAMGCIERDTCAPEFVCITDGRRGYEFDYFKQKGFVMIGVIADDDIRMSRLLERDGDSKISRERLNHPIEMEAMNTVMDCDYIITNNDEVEKLYDEIDTKFIPLLRKL